MNLIHYNEIFLTGTQNATPDQFARTVALLPHLDSLERLVTHRFPLERTPDAFAARFKTSPDGLMARLFGAHQDIRVEVQRGDTRIVVSWPVQAAPECSAWLRSLG